MLSTVSCKRVISLALDGPGAAGSATPPVSATAIAPPPTVAAAPQPPPAVEEDDDEPPPVHMPHVPITPATATTNAKPPAPTEAFPATCAGICEKTLKCMNAWNATEQAACVSECSRNNPNPTKIAELNRKDCASLLTTLEGGGGGGGSAKGGAAPSTCNADCYGCVWDGNECYYLNGSMIGMGTVHCAPCCCAKGGPAKRWE